MDEEVERGRRKKRDLLQHYYKGNGSVSNSESDQDVAGAAGDPLDIDCRSFQPKLYIEELLTKKTLNELIDKQDEMIGSIKELDSNMQTLVYENYNKFIGATDTIRKMKNDFKKMEDEMDSLASSMDNIVAFSGQITSTLHGRRSKLSDLHGVHGLLGKLQYLFDLPAQLKRSISNGDYHIAVRSYIKTRDVISRYKDMPSFRGIHADCEAIVADMIIRLKSRFRQPKCTAEQLSECVDLLLQLNEPSEDLYQEYLAHAGDKLSSDLGLLTHEIEKKQRTSTAEESKLTDQEQLPVDILEFVDMGCNNFLSNMCLIIAAYTDMFLSRGALRQGNESSEGVAVKMLNQFVIRLMSEYFSAVESRLKLEELGSDTNMLVRAMDRFYRKLQAMNKLLPGTDFSVSGNEIVLKTSAERVQQTLCLLKQQFNDTVTDIRHSLASPKLLGKSVEDGKMSLSDLLDNLNKSIVDQVKQALQTLQIFLESGQNFSSKSSYRNQFCLDVRKALISHLDYLYSIAQEYCDITSVNVPALLLILARFCADMGQHTITYLVNYVDEMFIADTSQVTPIGSYNEKFKEIGKRLLNHYVRIQGQVISQLLRKSVETRDWLNTIEPRTVRAVMKRVIEDVTSTDTLVAQLFEEGAAARKTGSDSSRRTFNMSSASKLQVSGNRQNPQANWTYAASLNSNSIISNIQKLFSEKIEIFTAIEFNRVSILTGIIKISLKAFVECVRLRSFGTYGLQQLQVDTHYLQNYLWRFVSDENIVHSLLDEIVNSAVHRCINPVLMEPSVVELICDSS